MEPVFKNCRRITAYGLETANFARISQPLHFRKSQNDHMQQVASFSDHFLKGQKVPAPKFKILTKFMLSVIPAVYC